MWLFCTEKKNKKSTKEKGNKMFDCSHSENYL